jgi:hypothetical protein
MPEDYLVKSWAETERLLKQAQGLLHRDPSTGEILRRPRSTCITTSSSWLYTPSPQSRIPMSPTHSGSFLETPQRIWGSSIGSETCARSPNGRRAPRTHARRPPRNAGQDLSCSDVPAR